MCVSSFVRQLLFLFLSVQCDREELREPPQPILFQNFKSLQFTLSKLSNLHTSVIDSTMPQSAGRIQGEGVGDTIDINAPGRGA